MNRRAWLLPLAVALSALATPSSSNPPVFPNGIDNVPARPTPPPWPNEVDVVQEVNRLRAPSGRDVDRFYPPKAMTNEKSGRAVLRCRFGEGGAFAACGIAAEAPKGYGFGEAAMKMANIFLYEPNDVDGRPVKGRAMDIDVIFRLGE